MDLNELLSNTALWGLLLGLVTPLATAVVQRPGWSARTRTLVGHGVSLLVGALTVLASGEIENGTVTAATLFAVLAASKIAYTQVWQRTPVTDTIEYATTPGVHFLR